MHAHIQSIMQATHSIDEIERAFWGGRHPAWNKVEKRFVSKGLAYHHELTYAIPSATGDTERGRLVFQWTVYVDWAKDPVTDHDFILEMFVESGGVERRIAGDCLRISSIATVTLKRDVIRGPMLSRAASAISLWRRRYRDALARVGVGPPESFDHPELPSVTYRELERRREGIPEFVSELGTFILDELCRVPMPQGA